jgi:hypothetical protein
VVAVKKLVVDIMCFDGGGLNILVTDKMML